METRLLDIIYGEEYASMLYEAWVRELHAVVTHGHTFKCAVILSANLRQAIVTTRNPPPGKS